MKPIKAIFLALGMYTAFPLLSVHGQADDNISTAYQSHIFDFIQQHIPESINYQAKWQRMTGFEHSGLHWEQFVVVYTNKGDLIYKHNFLQYSAWFDDPEDEDNEPAYKAYSTGTVFIKENYGMNNGKPGHAESVTVMIKRKPGFNPNGGDWEYMQFDKKGKKIIKGKSNNKLVKSACASCHENVAERDYIFSSIYSGASQ